VKMNLAYFHHNTKIYAWIEFGKFSSQYRHLSAELNLGLFTTVHAFMCGTEFGTILSQDTHLCENGKHHTRYKFVTIFRRVFFVICQIPSRLADRSHS
jgi:hypothetical protein